jgi:hypothetical protein
LENLGRVHPGDGTQSNEEELDDKSHGDLGTEGIVVSGIGWKVVTEDSIDEECEATPKGTDNEGLDTANTVDGRDRNSRVYESQ